jgi:hypothetical protein
VFAAGVNEDSSLQIASDGRYPTEIPTFRRLEPTFHNLKLVFAASKCQTQTTFFLKVNDLLQITPVNLPKILDHFLFNLSLSSHQSIMTLSAAG